ncbi:MAG: alpha/beta hydrolase [Sphingobacteriales bacterium]|nr:alpha/beta hydrolase [Sphingobacteriales bacterium]
MQKTLTTFFIIIGLFIIWVALAQTTLKRRVSDQKARELFKDNGVKLFTGTVNANGFQLHYAKVGYELNPTLIFVHGTPGSWIRYKRYLLDKELLLKFRMISVDRPGFGYSSFGDAKNLEKQSEIITHLIKAVNNDRPVYLVGASFGGPVIARLAIDNPNMFSALLLLAPALDPAAEIHYFWRPLFFKTPLKFLVPGVWKPNNQELWYLKQDLAIMAQLLTDIDCSVYVLHGDKDKLVPVSNAFYAQRMLVKAKPLYLSIIPGGSHYVADENYTMVKEILMKLN